MSWVTVVWSISSGACLTLAFLQFIVWWKDRATRANLVFALGAVAVAVFAGLELALMRAETPAQWDTIVRWIHVPAWVLIVSIVAFVRLYLNAGRRWLAWTVVAVRTLALIVNFAISPNINYRKVTALRHMPFLGEPVSVPIGVPNPWMLVAQFSLLLLVIFVVDATITVWQRGNRRQALVVGGSIVLLVILASGQAVAITWGILATPLTVSLFYLVLVAAMAYELSYDLIRSAQLNRQLQASEATLRESEERFRIVADAAPVLIWMSGVDKLCTFFNKRWLEFTGRSLEQEMGDGWADGVHPVDLQKCLKTYTEAFDARKPFVMQYRLRRNDGEYRWISDDGVPRYDADGAFAGYIGSCVDVTDLIRQQRALHQFEERVALAAEAAHMGVWEFDVTRNRFWVSDKVRELFQFPAEGDITYAEFEKRVHPDDREARDRVMREAIRSHSGYETEYRVVLPDGTTRWIGGRARCLAEGDGKSTRLLGVSVDITKRKEAELALSESEERMRLAAEAANLGIWEWDFKADEVWSTQMRRSLFGLPGSGKITINDVISLVHIDDRDRIQEELKRAIESGEEYASEYRLVLPGGGVRWMEARGRCVPGVDGKAIALRGISMDVTKEKHAEELFRLATEASPSGMLLVNEHGQIVLINARIEKLFGYQRDELIGKFIEVLVPERFVTGHPAHRASFFAAPKPRSLGAGRDLFARRKDGTEFPVEIAVNPVQTPEGTLVLATVIDITERKQAEEKFRLAVEASPSGILIVNQTGQIVLVNSQIEELFGYGREELIGQSVETLVPERFASAHPEHRATFFAAPAARAMGAGRELFARRKDGSEFPVEIGLNPIQSPEGMLILAVVVDISARLTAEEETHRSREQVELLGRVSLLGEMTASLAHELNQPLAAIVNNATAAMQYLEQGRLDPEKLRDILADVAGDGHRAYDIMRNVRAAIKKGSAIRGSINLNDVVKVVTHLVQPDAASQFCQVKMSLAPDLPAIEGDPTQIQQVLINLVHNAVDAMHDTPPTRRIVEIATNHNGDRTISVVVRDYGPGISEATRERLFEQFFTTKKEGLGMGLAIVRSIVEAHGGSIAAENAEGGGARFCFRLPVKEEVPR